MMMIESSVLQERGGSPEVSLKMHRCFAVPEILNLICNQCVKFSNPPRLAWNTLASLARTSRSFQEPALQHLWYEIDTIAPLIKCMPRDLWEAHGKSLVFKRRISHTDWAIFKKYARRVRIVDSTNARRVLYVSREVLDVLRMAACGCTLLPSITTFIYRYIPADQSFPDICLFLGPNLTQLKIWIPSSLPPLQSSIFANLATQYPALTSLTVMRINEPDVVAALSDTICGWNNLRRLEVGAISADALAHIATLPSLQDLQLIEDYPGSLPSAMPSNLPSRTFPSLKALSVSGPAFPFFTALLRSMMICSHLTSIRFHTTRIFPTSTQWKDLLQAIEDVCARSALHHVSINDIEATSGPQGPKPFLTRNTLKLLLDFPDLLSIDLRTIGYLEIDNGMIESIALACPNLTSLVLSGAATGKPRTTLVGLLPFAKHCPQLTRLTLAFDATSVPTARSTSKIKNQLKTLNVLQSPMEKPPRVAAFLSDIFPNLQIVFSSDGTPRGEDDKQYNYSEVWGEMNGLVEEFLLVRKQEAARRYF